MLTENDRLVIDEAARYVVTKDFIGTATVKYLLSLIQRLDTTLESAPAAMNSTPQVSPTGAFGENINFASEARSASESAGNPNKPREAVGIYINLDNRQIIIDYK